MVGRCFKYASTKHIFDIRLPKFDKRLKTLDLEKFCFVLFEGYLMVLIIQARQEYGI